MPEIQCVAVKKPHEQYGIPDESYFVDEDNPEKRLDFVDSPELADIGRALIKSRDALKHLKFAYIVYLWKDKGGASQGAATLGKCQKPTGLLKHFADCDYVVWIAADHTRDRKFESYQIEALMFHELMHAQLDDKGNYAVRGHDFEGFAAEISFYGAWKQDIVAIEKAFQPTLFDGVEAEKATPESEQGTITISHGDKSATFTHGDLKAAVKKIQRKARRNRKSAEASQ